MFDIFRFLQCEMILRIVGPLFVNIYCNLQWEKLLDFNAFPANLHWHEDSEFFPTCWILIGQFKFPARQPYARAGCVWTEALSGKKKLQIQKYPETCKCDLRWIFRSVLFDGLRLKFLHFTFHISRSLILDLYTSRLHHGSSEGSLTDQSRD